MSKIVTPQEKDVLVSEWPIIFLGMGLLIILLLFSTIIFVLIWGPITIPPSLSLLISLVKIIVVSIAISFVHEGVHILGYMIWGHLPRRHLHLIVELRRFAIYCDAPVTVRVYRIAIFMPTIITGILPVLIAFSFNQYWFLISANLALVGCVVDWALLWKLRFIPKTALAIDHPTKAGCKILES